ncbi:MAG: lipoprotein signal peptidase [Ferruginibacter sp.]
MKGFKIAAFIAFLVIADQVLKIYVKTHFHVGESHAVAGNWFRLYFIENEGMAYGWKFGGEFGKMFLTLFRLAAVIYGVFYIQKIIKKKYHTGFIICVALIFAGALGNLIDSMFYGMIFEESSIDALNVAKIFPAHGYAGFLHGNVVDMLYFPIIRNTTFPSWVPFWGGQDFEFFRPIFNLADASISTGIITLLLFQKRFFKTKDSKIGNVIETKTVVNDEVQVL